MTTPTGSRLRQNFLGGLLDATLSATGTTLTSGGLSLMQAVTAPNYLPIVLDPDGYVGEPEIVWVTAHTASNSTATILRGQEGTVARIHQVETVWVHGPTRQDWESSVSAYVHPTLAQISYLEAIGSGTFNVTGQTFATVICNSEVYDAGNRHDITTGFYTVPQTGTYYVEGQFRASTDSTLNNLNIGIGIGPTNADESHFVWATTASGAATNRHTISIARMGRFVAGDNLRLFTYIDAAGTYSIGARRLAIRLVAVD